MTDANETLEAVTDDEETELECVAHEIMLSQSWEEASAKLRRYRDGEAAKLLKSMAYPATAEAVTTHARPLMPERLRAQLTEAAKRIWPGHADEIYVAEDGVYTGRGHMLLMVDAQHPRAQAVLSAALYAFEGGAALYNISKANSELGMAYTALVLQLRRMIGAWDERAHQHLNEVKPDQDGNLEQHTMNMARSASATAIFACMGDVRAILPSTGEP